MKRVLVLNNYSINRVLKEVELGYKPAHHLYGVLEIQQFGYQTILIDTDVNSLTFKFGKLISKIPLLSFGDLYLQKEAIRLRNHYDFIYAPCQDVTILLGILSYFGLFKKKIIAVAHHPFLKGRLKMLRKLSLFFSINGHYQFPALSSCVASQINTISRNKKSFLLHWGPDLEYYAQYLTKDSELKYDLISIGRTGRDYKTLINAFRDTDIRVVIYCNKTYKAEIDNLCTSNIDIHYLDSDESLTYSEIIQLYKTARAIAIPLLIEDSLSGLTSITDAIACKKFVLMTFNQYIDLDPKKYKFGLTIQGNNTNNWFMNANVLLEEVIDGKAYPSLPATEFNSKVFVQELITIFESIK